MRGPNNGDRSELANTRWCEFFNNNRTRLCPLGVSFAKIAQTSGSVVKLPPGRVHVRDLQLTGAEHLQDAYCCCEGIKLPLIGYDVPSWLGPVLAGLCGGVSANKMWVPRSENSPIAAQLCRNRQPRVRLVLHGATLNTTFSAQHSCTFHNVRLSRRCTWRPYTSDSDIQDKADGESSTMNIIACFSTVRFSRRGHKRCSESAPEPCPMHERRRANPILRDCSMSAHQPHTLGTYLRYL